MDFEMGEDAMEGDFLSLEIDLDYEFDASRYFDFSREESLSEAWASEVWFETARSYPPSPFIAKVDLGKDVIVENVNYLPKMKDEVHSSYICGHTKIGAGTEFSAVDESCKVPDFMVEDIPREDKKFTKGSFSSGSTLMRPTASHLAKQNRLREVKRNQFVNRHPKPSLPKTERSFEDPSENGCHAAKRQKVEGGHLRKVVGVKEETDLLHKAPLKKSGPAPQLPRLRITIPREPELETAQRAQRLRAQRLKSNDGNQAQEVKMPAKPIFKARPLNRKILETPSLPLPQKSAPRLPEFQPFNLKTQERALQHSLATSSSLVSKKKISTHNMQTGVLRSRQLQCQPSGPSRLQNEEQKRDERDDILPKFKARPLNQTILSSKGDIGVFRCTKREPTIPIEFNFSTNKRCKQDPPTELFKQLSLNMEAQQGPAPQTMFALPFCGSTKGWKENISSTLQGHKGNHVKKEELQRCGTKQISRSQTNNERNFGIG